jgi:hypothetical protein
MLRRHFVGWIMALAALPTSVRAASRRLRGSFTGQRAAPSQAAIRALGAVLLPSELGKAKLEVACDAFWRWMNGYREGAELLHPYGSPRISFSGKSPVPAWTKQYEELDRAARSKHGAAFATLTVKNREALVREALSGFKGERLTSIVSAPHIALGMLAHFYDSSAATDLCYRARIGRNSCRPLAHNGRKPLPIA